MKRITINWLLMLLAALSACSVAPDYSNPVSHDLGPVAQPSAKQSKIFLQAPVWLWDERIRYRLLYDDDTAIRYYNLDRWEAPLPALLERHFAGIGSNPVTLKIRLTQFEQQFQTPKEARVVMRLSVSAFLDKDHRLLGKRTFSLSQDTGTPDAAGAIKGFIALVGKAKADIQTWLSTLSDRQNAALQADIPVKTS